MLNPSAPCRMRLLFSRIDGPGLSLTSGSVIGRPVSGRVCLPRFLNRRHGATTTGSDAVRSGLSRIGHLCLIVLVHRTLSEYDRARSCVTDDLELTGSLALPQSAILGSGQSGHFLAPPGNGPERTVNLGRHPDFGDMTTDVV